jgi:hypothetical protein
MYNVIIILSIYNTLFLLCTMYTHFIRVRRELCEEIQLVCPQRTVLVRRGRPPSV